MSTLEKFITRDMQCALKKPPVKSYMCDASKKIWREVLKGVKEARSGTSLARAIIFKCAGGFWEGFDNKGIDKEEFALDSIMPALFESISIRKGRLEKDPAWQEVLLAETEDDRKDAIDAFINLCVASFKNDCIEVWRNREGTFANTYRKTQRALREHFKDASWSLYDPKSRFFGPAGMEDPLRLDELHGDKLKNIPLPADAPVSKRIFYKDSILPLSAWFYGELNLRTPQESQEFSERTCVAIRNFARWLCFSYPLLINEDVATEEEMVKIGKSVGNEYTLFKDIDALAKKAAVSLNSLQRTIIILKMDDCGDNEIASRAGLDDPADVKEHMDIIGRVVRDASMELPEICAAADMDSAQDGPDSGFLKRRFSDSFIKYCSEEPDNV